MTTPPPPDDETAYFFVFDCEAIGLHGDSFAVAGGIYDQYGVASREFCYACPRETAAGTDQDREWVAANIPPMAYTHPNPLGVRMAFWRDWTYARAIHPKIQMAVECGWPVEARFLAACIDEDPDRASDGPYPLLEISTMMQAAGMDPMATYKRKPEELPAHDPRGDARLSARLLRIARNNLESMGERKSLVTGALDTLASALTKHGHTWTDGERAIYEEALIAMGIPRRQITPERYGDEPGEEPGEEWKKADP